MKQSELRRLLEKNGLDRMTIRKIIERADDEQVNRHLVTSFKMLQREVMPSPENKAEEEA